MLYDIIILHRWTLFIFAREGRLATELSAECVCSSDPLFPDFIYRICRVDVTWLVAEQVLEQKAAKVECVEGYKEEFAEQNECVC